jgi:hypothetical protein
MTDTCKLSHLELIKILDVTKKNTVFQVEAYAARTQAQQRLPLLRQSAIVERICWSREE